MTTEALRKKSIASSCMKWPGMDSDKQSMKVGEHDGLTLQHQSQNFLMTYRSTPHATTGQSPASLFPGRPIRTQFDLVRPVVGEKVRVEQDRQKQCHDAHASYGRRHANTLAIRSSSVATTLGTHPSC